MAIQNALNLTATGVITHDGAGTFTGSTLTEGGVVLAGASNSITDTGVLAKGDLIAGDGTTAPSLLNVGTNDYVLTADSAEATGLKWADVSGLVSGGAWVHISTQTASNDATIDFTGIDGTYDYYALIIANSIPSADEEFYMRIGTGATPTWQTGSSYTYNFNGAYTVSDTKIKMSGTAVGTDTNEYGWSGIIKIFDPSSTSVYTRLNGVGGYTTGSGSQSDVQVTAEYKATTAVTGVRFYFSSGNVESGKFSLYGITSA